MISIELMYTKLQERFNPTELKIVDESYKHQGHQGFREGMITHIKIIIKAQEFVNQNKVSIHRQIYNTLAEELRSGLHAVSIEVKE
jgi:BolA protein